MEIIPGRSVGPFFIGSPIRSVLAHLVSGQRLKYDTDFLFDEKAPYNFDIVLDLKNIGIQLRFDPITQRLWTIDVYDIGKINPAGKFELIERLSAEFSLRYRVEESAATVTATGAKSQYFSNFRKASELGYVPAYTTADGIVQELKSLLDY